jgi:hypothetical protein
MVKLNRCSFQCFTLSTFSTERLADGSSDAETATVTGKSLLDYSGIAAT